MPMRNIRLTIEYDGTNFLGWQIQTKNSRTVQGEIQKALKKIFKKSIRLIGSGRTDRGAHAIGQVANFKTNTKLKTAVILRALNAHLPPDIVITDAADVPLNFHSRYSAKSKTYRYAILNRNVPDVLTRNFCYFYPRKLNVSLMRREAKHMTGRKDFRSFMAADPSSKDRERSTIRTIKRLVIRKNGDVVRIDIEANSFLYKMVRNIVGTLIAIGSGKLPEGSIKNILSKKNRTCAGTTAPAHGLCLVNVTYEYRRMFLKSE